jgi:hypothetical protein
VENCWRSVSFLRKSFRYSFIAFRPRLTKSCGTMTKLIFSIPQEVLVKVIIFPLIFFVIFMDRLTHMIAYHIETDYWVLMRVGRYGSQISHLLLLLISFFCWSLFFFCGGRGLNPRPLHILCIVHTN